MRVPILTYHSNNIAGNDYAGNDHVALAEDLRVIAGRGLRIVPLARVVDVLLGEAPESAVERAVALSFDDGSWFDWHDLDHPLHGPQRGFAGILRGFATVTGAAVHATSFVIVSPDARAALDRTCLAGRGWWDDAWWPAAEREGLVAIESHSWDHNHGTLPVVDGRRRGTFLDIDTYAAADAQLRRSSEWLDAACRVPRPGLFAYPYGEAGDYLVRDYLPRFAHEHRLRAAFATQPRPVEQGCNRWHLPRYVCGRDWHSPGELERLVAGVG
jgi:peptidoglycan/xylan/chitin deacetylase (PgdA/CDA1 family)